MTKVLEEFKMELEGNNTALLDTMASREISL